MKDEKIISLLRKGQESTGLVQLYRYEGKVCAHVKANSGTKDDGKEIFQEALFHLVKKCQTENFTLSSSIDTYLFGVAKNLWSNRLRKKKPELMGDLPEGIEEHGEEGDRGAAIQKALLKLTEKCRELLVAFYFDGFKMEEIAKDFGFSSAKSAKNQKYKCLEKARSYVLPQSKQS